MFFDSHAHLNFKNFKNDYEEIIKRCLAEKIWMVNVGCGYDYSQLAIEIAEKYETGVWAAIGLHPSDVEKENFDYQKFLALAKNSAKVVVIGETGLDYHHVKNIESRTKQKELFLEHVKLAAELKLPLTIHCREAYDELIELLRQASAYKPHGVIHCFSGNSQQAGKYLELGFYLGFTGIITYSSDYDQIIKDMPLEKILIETDCPYLAPVPRRGQRNEPAYIKFIARKIADIREISLEKVAEQTFQNSLQLFNIKS